MPSATPESGTEPDDPSAACARTTARAPACAARRLACAAAILALVAPLASASGAASEAQNRVIVLGFDGADARTVEKLMDAGELPNLARLRASGTYAPLGTTVPAESPVSWAALNSGQNPAKTGVPGFVKRDLGASGDPTPALGHQVREGRATTAFALNPLVAFLARRSPAECSVWGGAIALLLSVVVFLALLRMRARVALALAVLFGALGAWAGWKACTCVPRRIVNVVGNPTHAGGFWEVAARAGVKSVVLDAAMGWDRPNVENARVLAGLGVPDVRGENGDWFVYTSDPHEEARPPQGHPTQTSGQVFRVDFVGDRMETWIYGPRDLVNLDRLERDPAATEEELEAARGRRDSEAGRLKVPLQVVRRGAKAWISIDGEAQELGAGEWSRWYHLTFEMNALMKVHAITRVKLVKLAEPFSLYVDFLQIDPAGQPFWQPVSQPVGFASELAKSIDEPFETVGWACMTMPFKDRQIEPEMFLEDAEFTARWREKLLHASLARDDWRLLMCVESTPDRVQHMLYQFYDPTHPMYDATKAARRTRYFGREIALSDAIPASYREMDRLVGEVVEQRLRPGDTLIVCSDHGFQSFRRGVNLNNWLFEHGFLALRPGTTPARQGNDYLQWVDWERTRAYAVGLGMIFLNLKGRESQGVVDPAEAPALLEEIGRELLATKDGDRSVVRSIYRMSDIHSGPYLALEADLMPGFEAGYRVGWATTTGGIRLKKTADGASWIPGESIEDNTLNWSGDHVSVAQDLVRGVFFCNRKVDVPATGIDLLDIAPTALSVLGVPVPREYDRPPLAIRD